MHVVPPHQTSVTLFSSDGEVYFFKTLSQALRELGMAFLSRHVGPHFRVHLYDLPESGPRTGSWRSRPVYASWPYVMRDDNGGVVLAKDFLKLHPSQHTGISGRFGHWNGEGPVPGTGNSRSWKTYRLGRIYRDLRQSQILEEDGEPPLRYAMKSGKKAISFDRRRERRTQRNWKAQRQTQWKSV